MPTEAEYRVEHVARAPQGFHVRTLAPGPKSDHLIRVAFPPGRRRRGSGQLVEILHPPGENPTRCNNPSSAYSMAVRLGYPYIRGEGRVAADGRTWLGRATKTADGTGPAIFVGWDSANRKWIIEKEEAENPSPLELRREARERAADIRKARLSRGPRFRESARGNPDLPEGDAQLLVDSIRHGDKVTILVPAGFGRGGQEWEPRSGRAVMRGPAGWVLNLGGAHGTPGIASARNIVSVRRSNPGKKPRPRKGESAPEYHARRVREILAKMPKPIRDVFDRNPAEYKFIFRNEARRNPDEDELERAEELFETFHGREPREILEMQESSEMRGEYTALGDLVELTMIAPNGNRVKVNFKNDGVRVASSPDAAQLYLLGGNQDISGNLELFGADESKDLIDLGEAKQIVYDAAKWQTNFDPQEWKHDFGEESGIRPRGFYDQLKKRIFFAGGTYKVERPGIVD